LLRSANNRRKLASRSLTCLHKRTRIQSM
jgi:hypothetical protein